MQSNRENILSSAQRLFTSRGYDAVGVKEICDAAGITKPTLYHYFGNKRGLLDALIAERGEGFMNILRAVSIYRGDVTKTLTDIAREYFRFVERDPGFFTLYLSMLWSPVQSEPFKAVVAMRDNQNMLLGEVFFRASSDHGNMKGRHEAFAASFFGTIHTYVWLHLTRGMVLDENRIYETVRQFMHGIFS